jgi:hypothetical protein
LISLKKNNINAWINVVEGNQAPGLLGQITKGLNEAAVVIAYLSDEYCLSENCRTRISFHAFIIEKANNKSDCRHRK